MGFIKRNKFESAWDMALIYTPKDIGVAGSLDDPTKVIGPDILAVATGAAEKAFEDGLHPDDAVLIGTTYLKEMLTAKYPDRVKRNVLGPTLDEIASVLTQKYGAARIRDLRLNTASFAAYLGVQLRPKVGPSTNQGSAQPGPTSRVGREVGYPDLLDLDDIEPIREWFGEIQTTVQVVKNFALSAADAKPLRFYAHVPRTRRVAEVALYFMWWAERFVWEQISDTSRRELAGETIRSLVSEDFPDMDLIGQDRYTELSGIHTEGAGTLALAAVPLRGMDSGIRDEEAVSVLASYQSMLIEKLDAVWK